jgi:hypothetical protein
MAGGEKLRAGCIVAGIAGQARTASDARNRTAGASM